MGENKTNNTQPKTSQIKNKLEGLYQTLNKEVVVAIRGEYEQHIKVKQGYVYELEFKDGDVLKTDFDLTVKKVGDDLEVLVGNDTTVIFDNYFSVCTGDLSCLVSVPASTLYHVVENDFITLADGSQIIYFYGDEYILPAIDSNKSNLPEQSFNDVYLDPNADSNIVGDLNNPPVPPTNQPTLSLHPNELGDHFISGNETDIDLEVAATGLNAGDEIQLYNGTDLVGGVHTVTAAEALAGKVMIKAPKNDLDNGVDGKYPITATITDAAGNPPETTNTVDITLDTTAPTVTSITSSTIDGTYNATAPLIDISVIVDSEMIENSEITITLGTDSTGIGTNATVILTRDGINAKLYTGTYDVQRGDDSDDLDVIDINSGTATDLAGNALLSEPLPVNNLAYNKALVIKTITGQPIISVKQDPYIDPDAEPKIEERHIKDQYINIDEDGITLEITAAGMSAGNTIQLYLDNVHLNFFTHLLDLTNFNDVTGVTTFELTKEDLVKVGNGLDGVKNITAVVLNTFGESEPSDLFEIVLDRERPTIDITDIDGDPLDNNNGVVTTDVTGKSNITVSGTSRGLVEKKISTGLDEYQDITINYAVDQRFLAKDLDYFPSTNVIDWTNIPGWTEHVVKNTFAGMVELEANTELYNDPNEGVVLKVIDDGAGVINITNSISFKEGEKILEHGATVSINMSMDTVDGKEGGTLTLCVEDQSNDTNMFAPQVERDYWTVDIATIDAAAGTKLSINGVPIDGYQYDGYNLYELVIGKENDTTASLYINGEFAVHVERETGIDGNLTNMRSNAIEWSSGSNKGGGRTVYIKDMGFSVLTGEATATVNDNGDWTAKIPTNLLSVNNYLTLTASAKDLAGNSHDVDTSVTSNQDKIFIEEVLAPLVTGFSSTTDSGSFTVGQTINITAIMSEQVVKDSRIKVTLDTFALDSLGTPIFDTVILEASNNGYELTGTYMVSDTDQSDALTITKIEVDLSNNPPTTAVGSKPMTDTGLPTGNNLDDNYEIVINQGSSDSPVVASVSTVLTERVTDWTDVVNIKQFFEDVSSDGDNARVITNVDMTNAQEGDSNLLYKSSHWIVNDWIAGAISQDIFSGNFSVSRTVTRDNTFNAQESMLGISKDDNLGEHQQDIEYRLYVRLERGGQDTANSDSGKGTNYYVSAYTLVADDDKRYDKGKKEVNIGDVVTIEKKGRDLIYLINGEPFWTEENFINADDEFYIDTSIKSDQTSISNIVVEYNHDGVTATPVVTSSIDSITQTYTFSEKVKGLDQNDFDIENGTITDVYAVNLDHFGFSEIWKVKITPNAGIATGEIKLTLKAHSVEDRAGKENEDNYVPPTIEMDTIAPTVTSISGTTTAADSTKLVAGDEITLSVVVDDDMTADSQILVTLETGLIDQTVVLTRTADSRTYTGIYTVQADDYATDLSVKSIDTLRGKGLIAPTDANGNLLDTNISVSLVENNNNNNNNNNNFATALTTEPVPNVKNIIIPVSSNNIELIYAEQITGNTIVKNDFKVYLASDPNTLIIPWNVILGTDNKIVLQIKGVNGDELDLTNETVMIEYTPSTHSITMEWAEGVSTQVSAFSAMAGGHGKYSTVRVTGNDDDNLIFAGAADNIVDGGDGDDIIIGGSGNDIIRGGLGHDTLTGDNGKDTVDGGDGDDIIRGGLGNDTLTGGNGDDLIRGGLGNDTLTGGNGKDTFIYYDGDINLNNKEDTITDFQIGPGGDVINLADLLDYHQGDNINDFLEVKVRNTIDKKQTNILVDVDSDGATDLWIVLLGRTDPLTLGDMIADDNIVYQ